MDVNENIELLISEVRKSNERKKTDSIIIKIVGGMLTVVCVFFITFMVNISNKVTVLENMKADRVDLNEKLSVTSYAILEENRAKSILNYVDDLNRDVYVKDEELICARVRLDNRLKDMIQVVTTRSGK